MKVLARFPRVLEYKSERTLRPRLDFLCQECGVAQQDISKVCWLLLGLGCCSHGMPATCVCPRLCCGVTLEGSAGGSPAGAPFPSPHTHTPPPSLAAPAPPSPPPCLHPRWWCGPPWCWS